MARNADDVRVGLVGYGLAGAKFHAPLIAVTDGLELVAIVTADPLRRQGAMAANPGATLFDNAAELLAAGDDLGLELVVVAAPNRAHVSVALAALDAGYAVVVDKPLATTAAAGRRVVAEAEARGLLLSVFHNRRWDGDFLTVRRLVESGALGQVLRFESRFERWRPQVKVGSWRERPEADEGGGVLLDLGTHIVDQALVLFGPPATVYAEVTERRLGAATDDDAFIALSHASGVITHLWASAVTARPGPRFRVMGSRAGYVVFGMDVQEASLIAGKFPRGADWGQAPASQRGTIGADDDTQAIPTEQGDYPAYYQGIVASLSQGAPPPVLPMDAITGLEVLDAARESAASGEVVHFVPD